jgi:glycerol uptake facilitator-like aquaporin
LTDLPRRLAAEGAGTAALVATVVGSGIMAQRLTDDVALQLLANALPTGAMLVVLITVLAPLSGAHFNPAVTLVFALRREIELQTAALYVGSQLVGAMAGTVLAHAMFGEPLLVIGSQVRTGAGQWLSEVVATFGLVAIIFGGLASHRSAVPWLVGLYIVAAYWFTSSTSFANPAVTLARGFTTSFAGIRLLDVPAFVAAQVIGALLGGAAIWWFGGAPPLLGVRHRGTKRGTR